MIIPNLNALEPNSRPRLDYYRHMRTLVEKYDLANLKAGDKKSSSGFCLHNGKDLFVYYVPKENINIGVTLPKVLEGGVMTGVWFDPFTGTTGEPIKMKISKWPSFDKPKGNQFSILIVKIHAR